MTPERRTYCALDVATTRGVADALLARLADNEVPGASAIYDFERALQGPALTMSLRGMRVDRTRIAMVLNEIEQEAAGHRDILAADNCSFTYNRAFAPSPAQVSTEIYVKRGAARRYSRKTGASTTDDEALAALAKSSPALRPICEAVLALRRADKDRETLERGIDADGRLRASWNVGATETGRWSSSSNPMRTGGNMQNVRKTLRAVFVADPGWTLFQADLRCAESHAVAYLSGDTAYISAHETPGADTHCLVARMLWPDEPWPRDATKHKAWANEHRPAWGPTQPLRQWSKRTQHAKNYRQGDRGTAMTLGIRIAQAAAFGRAYYGAFGALPVWHDSVAHRLTTTGQLTTPLGRTRQFLGHRGDDGTLREAIAFEPQSLVSDIQKIALLRVWAELDRGPAGNLQLLGEGHDALLGQVRRGHESLAEDVIRLMRVKVPVRGIDGVVRELVLGAECKLGETWKDVS